ncbi:MAG: hypothetical protein V2A66_07445 [Pseudomonadota bacterium]
MGLGVGIAGLALIIGGGVCLGIGQTRYDEARSLANTAGTSPNYDEAIQAYRAFPGTYDQAKDLATAGWALAGVGVAAAVAGIALVVSGRRMQSEKTVWLITPFASGGAAVYGTF